MTQTVRRYYDQNTRLFLRIGSTPGAQAIHRALWPEGTRRLDDALNISNQYLLDEALNVIRRDGLREIHLADLGCGVGGTLLFLLEKLRLPAHGLGVTISPLQARLGARALRERGWEHACAISEADFQALPAVACFDLAYAVESAVHAPDPACFYSEASRILRPAGRLVVIDDFLGETSAPDPVAHRQLEAYRSGWHTPGLISSTKAVSLARAGGLRLLADRDLTSLLRLRPLPDRLAGFLLAAGRRLPPVHSILPSMLGSLALQQCLQRGLLHYRLLVFEKTP